MTTVDDHWSMGKGNKYRYYLHFCFLNYHVFFSKNDCNLCQVTSRCLPRVCAKIEKNPREIRRIQITSVHFLQTIFIVSYYYYADAKRF